MFRVTDNQRDLFQSSVGGSSNCSTLKWATATGEQTPAANQSVKPAALRRLNFEVDHGLLFVIFVFLCTFYVLKN